MTSLTRPFFALNGDATTKTTIWSTKKNVFFQTKLKKTKTIDENYFS